MALIAREEGRGDDTVEARLREEFLHWETRSKCAPNGKWRGANSRKWGKVGIEMRLTGSVPRTEGPQTQLGKMVCKFVDVVELKDCAAGILGGKLSSSSPDDNNDGTATDAPQASTPSDLLRQGHNEAPHVGLRKRKAARSAGQGSCRDLCSVYAHRHTACL